MKKLICAFLIFAFCIFFCACNSNSDIENADTSFTETTTSSTTESTETTEISSETKIDYVLNTNSMKFHYPGCYAAKKISDKNRKEYHGTRTSLIEQGYDACGICNP